MKRILPALLAGLLALTSSFTSTVRADELDEIEKRKEEISDNQNQIESQLQDIESYENDIDLAFQEIARLSKERDQLQEEIESLKEEIRKLDESIEEKEAEKEKLEKDLDEKVEIFKKRLDVMYKNRNIGVINVLLEADNTQDFLTRLNSMKAVAGYDKDMIKEMNQIKEDLDFLIIQLKGTKASRDEAYANLSYKEARLMDSISDQQTMVTVLKSSKTLAEDEVARLDGVVQGLNSEIDDLQAQYQERIRREEEERKRREEEERKRREAELARQREEAANKEAGNLSYFDQSSIDANFVPYQGNVVYYNQRENPWAMTTYGTGIYSNIAMNGCGPTSMAMVLSTLTDRTVTPADMASFSMANGHCMPGDGGSYWTLFPAAASVYGLSCRQTSNVNEINQALSSGALVVVSESNGNGGYWTRGGHFIVLTGIDENGYISVADPWSRAKTAIKHSQYNVYNPMKMCWIING